MSEAVVEVRELRKTFQVTEREEGLAATFRSFVKRRRKDVNAVAGITFRIDAREVVGFLGPNGAGKTTTLKMLSGLLHPTAGEARVLEYVPWRRENAYLKSMILLMGNRTQLVWIGIAVTVPAQAISGRLDPAGLGLLVVGTFAAFVLASRFWRLGVRSYTGASA